METSTSSPAVAQFGNLLRSDLKDYCPASNLAFNERVKEMIAAGETVYHFGFGQSPFPVAKCFVKALEEHAGQNAYLPVAGLVELRQAICDFHGRHDRLTDLRPDQVLLGPGTKELIFLAALVFQGDVMVVSPSWTTYKPQVTLAHHSPYVINTCMEEGWKITPERVEQTIRDNNLTGNKMLILCNPDNPTGLSYSSEELQALSHVFRRHRVIVICDEIYARLHFEESHDTLIRYYPEGSILSSGFSKWASAGGWRVGYHIFPPQLSALRDAVRSAASHTYSCAPAPMQYALTQGLRQRAEVDSHIKHTSRVMAAVARFCHRELTSVGVKAILPTAGFYIFPNFKILRESLKKRGITQCQQMCDALFAESRVAVMAGGPAFLRPVDELTVRLCFVNFDGRSALDASIEHGLDQTLPDSFVSCYCRPVYDGIMALTEWVKKQLTEKET